jgi:hypothetical protein
MLWAFDKIIRFLQTFLLYYSCLGEGAATKALEKKIHLGIYRAHQLGTKLHF